MDKILNSRITTNILLIAIFIVLCYGATLLSEIESNVDTVCYRTSDIYDIKDSVKKIENDVSWRR